MCLVSLSLSLSGLHLFKFIVDVAFLFVVFLLVRTCGKTPSPACSVVFSLFTLPFPNPPHTFASTHSPTIPVCFVHTIKVKVFVLTLARKPPGDRLQWAAFKRGRRQRAQPLSRADSLKQVALLPSPTSAPPAAWFPSSAINHPKLINTNKAAS